jgi:hypothetical protein
MSANDLLGLCRLAFFAPGVQCYLTNAEKDALQVGRSLTLLLGEPSGIVLCEEPVF